MNLITVGADRDDKKHQSQSSIVYALRCGNFISYQRRIGEKNLNHCCQYSSDAEGALNGILTTIDCYVRLSSGHVINTEWVLAINKWLIHTSGLTVYFTTGDELLIEFLTADEAKDAFDFIKHRIKNTAFLTPCCSFSNT